MMVDPSKSMHMCIVSEMSNVHVHMLPKILSCIAVHMPKDVKVMDWTFKAVG